MHDRFLLTDLMWRRFSFTKATADKAAKIARPHPGLFRQEKGKHTDPSRFWRIKDGCVRWVARTDYAAPTALRVVLEMAFYRYDAPMELRNGADLARIWRRWRKGRSPSSRPSPPGEGDTLTLRPGCRDIWRRWRAGLLALIPAFSPRRR